MAPRLLLLLVLVVLLGGLLVGIGVVSVGSVLSSLLLVLVLLLVVLLLVLLLLLCVVSWLWLGVTTSVLVRVHDDDGWKVVPFRVLSGSCLMSGSSFRKKERAMKARRKEGKEGRKSELDERRMTRAKCVKSKNKNIRERSFYDSLFLE